MIPEAHRWLFWDVDPDTIDLRQHRDYVLERVMARGDWAAMRWLIKTFQPVDLAEFLGRKANRLPPRDRAFWFLIAGLERVSEPGGGAARVGELIVEISDAHRAVLEKLAPVVRGCYLVGDAASAR